MLHYYKCVVVDLLSLLVNNFFLSSPPPHFSVLQVSGTRAAIQLRPAGYAPAEEANVQRTVSLQAHPVTHTYNPAPPSTPALTPDSNKMEG